MLRVRTNTILAAIAAIAGIVLLGQSASIDYHRRAVESGSSDNETFTNLAYSSPYANVPQLAVTPPQGDTAKIAQTDTQLQPAQGGPFQCGVASGDPTPTAVILWTKISPSAPDSDSTVSVRVIVAENPDLSNPIVQGTAITSKAIDWTLKMEAGRLRPNTQYYYRFFALGSESPIGLTRTLPAQDENVDSIRFAVLSCATYWHGWFHSYRAAAGLNVDFVVHLGDYIYEYAENEYPAPGAPVPNRDAVPPTTVITLAEYRARYSHYRTDPDLQEMHRIKPMIAVWDDHEFVNNAYWSGGHNPDRFGPWPNRRRDAARAWWEYMPTRPVKGNTIGRAPVYRIYRKFTIGNLATLLMLDTRIVSRDEQTGEVPGDFRDLLGAEQRQWLYDELTDTATQWKLIGNQVMFTAHPNNVGPIDPSVLNDDWNGYPEERQLLKKYINANSIQNVVMFTGDFHSSIASNILANPDEDDSTNHLFVEFVGPSVTSKTPVGDSENLALVAEPLFKSFNEGIQFINLVQHGLMVATVNSTQTTVKYLYVGDIKNREGGEWTVAQTLVVPSGAQRIARTQSEDDGWWF